MILKSVNSWTVFPKMADSLKSFSWRKKSAGSDTVCAVISESEQKAF